MEKRLNLVIANNLGSGVESLKAACSSSGIVFDSVKQYNDRKLLKAYLENSGDRVTALIVFDELSGEKVTLQEMIRYHTLVNAQAVMIPVFTDDEKGSPFARKVLDAGLYNAIFCGKKSANRQQTVAVSELSSRLRSPYQYKDALQYFRLQGNRIFETPGESDGETVRKTAGYLRSYNGTQADLLSRLSEAREKMPGLLPEILSGLPDPMLRQLTGVPEYNLIVNSILQKREQRGFDEDEYDDDGEEAEMPRRRRISAGKIRTAANDIKKRGEKLFGGRGCKKEKQEKRPGREALRNTAELGFISTNIGVGCTYDALMCAFSLKRAGHRTAIVELDSEDENFRCLCRDVKKTGDVGACTTFSLGGVDFFFHLKLSDFRSGYRKGYEYVIYDCGSVSDAGVRSVCGFCDTIFVVTGAAGYKREELLEFLSAVRDADPARRFIYLFSDSDEKEIRGLRASMPKLRMAAVPHNRNPFNPKQKIRKLFAELAEGRYIPKKPGKGPGGIEERLRESSEDIVTRVLSALCAVMAAACLALLAVIAGKNAGAEALRQRAAEEVRKREESIAFLRDEASSARDELYGLRRTVTVFREPVAAGTRIFPGMTEEREVYSGFPSELYASEEEAVGKYVTCDMMPGVPIYRCNLAVRVEEALPYEIEHPGEGLREDGEDGGNDG